jgi:hypothetical protein
LIELKIFHNFHEKEREKKDFLKYFRKERAVKNGFDGKGVGESLFGSVKFDFYLQFLIDGFS